MYQAQSKFYKTAKKLWETDFAMIILLHFYEWI